MPEHTHHYKEQPSQQEAQELIGRIDEQRDRDRENQTGEVIGGDALGSPAINAALRYLSTGDETGFRDQVLTPEDIHNVQAIHTYLYTESERVGEPEFDNRMNNLFKTIGALALRSKDN